MKTRVTITLDSDIKSRAKLLALGQGVTLSNFVERILSEKLEHKQSKTAKTYKESIVDKMVGMASEVDQPAPGTDPKYDYLKAKYLK